MHVSVSQAMNKEIESLKQRRIGVLAGGSSSEREISLKSGRSVFGALRTAGLDVILIDVKESDLSSLIDRADIDVAFIALHGRFGEDGTVQSLLEKKNIPYTGSAPESSGMAFDKLVSKRKFEEAGLMVPGYHAVRATDDISRLGVSFPCVVKPRYEGSSIGLSLVNAEKDLKEAVDAASGFGDEIIIEEFVPGREVTVGVLDGEPLPVVEIIAAEGIYDFKAKYSSSDTKYIVPAQLKEDDYRRLQRTGLKAHMVLGCEGFSRVDFRLTDDGRIFILEVNTIPGLTERSLLPMAAEKAGLNVFQLCVRMLNGAFLKNRD